VAGDGRPVIGIHGTWGLASLGLVQLDLKATK
jgi:hypothetical protein